MSSLNMIHSSLKYFNLNSLKEFNPVFNKKRELLEKSQNKLLTTHHFICAEPAEPSLMMSITDCIKTAGGKRSRVHPPLSLCLFLVSLAPPSALARPKPYQGVRVRDPVKELLRRKRSLELHSTKTVPPTVVRAPWHAALTCMLSCTSDRQYNLFLSFVKF